MTVSLSPTDTNNTAYPHDSPLHHEQIPSGGPAQQRKEENHSFPASIQSPHDNAHSIGTPHRNYTGVNEVPSRPASRMDFVMGFSSARSAGALGEVETDAGSFTQTDSICYFPVLLRLPTLNLCPALKYQQRTSHLKRLDPSASNSLLLSSSSSGSYPALESITISLTPELRPKHTRLPCPLSLFLLVIPSPFSQSQSTPQSPSQSLFQPQRHLYTDRGHSRHDLHYRKWFWALREEDWARYQEACSGMSTSPVLTTQSSEQDKTCTLPVQGWQPRCRPSHTMCPSTCESPRKFPPTCKSPTRESPQISYLRISKICTRVGGGSREWSTGPNVPTDTLRTESTPVLLLRLILSSGGKVKGTLTCQHPKFPATNYLTAYTRVVEPLSGMFGMSLLELAAHPATSPHPSSDVTSYHIDRRNLNMVDESDGSAPGTGEVVGLVRTINLTSSPTTSIIPEHDLEDSCVPGES
ncbi:MAG: hypothetical protein NXY57DRAFT_965739 [Lentinula lateritia]|nr:MAG: hypothetical protein NXY57DRAFT_965739 [Lentinula lateritia]